MVYIVRCATGELYTGSTVDLQRRIGEHNLGVGAKFTRGRGPVVLVYSERCGTRSLALRRENEIKSMVRKAKLTLIHTASASTE